MSSAKNLYDYLKSVCPPGLFSDREESKGRPLFKPADCYVSEENLRQHAQAIYVYFHSQSSSSYRAAASSLKKALDTFYSSNFDPKMSSLSAPTPSKHSHHGPGPQPLAVSVSPSQQQQQQSSGSASQKGSHPSSVINVTVPLSPVSSPPPKSEKQQQQIVTPSTSPEPNVVIPQKKRRKTDEKAPMETGRPDGQTASVLSVPVVRQIPSQQDQTSMRKIAPQQQIQMPVLQQPQQMYIKPSVPGEQNMSSAYPSYPQQIQLQRQQQQQRQMQQMSYAPVTHQQAERYDEFSAEIKTIESQAMERYTTFWAERRNPILGFACEPTPLKPSRVLQAKDRLSRRKDTAILELQDEITVLQSELNALISSFHNICSDDVVDIRATLDHFKSPNKQFMKIPHFGQMVEELLRNAELEGIQINPDILAGMRKEFTDYAQRRINEEKVRKSSEEQKSSNQTEPANKNDSQSIQEKPSV